MDHREQKLPENKTFGLFFALVFCLAAIYSFYFYGAQLAAILFLVSLTLLVIAILKSEWLSVLNLAWSRLGIILSKIFNPIILGLIFSY